MRLLGLGKEFSLKIDELEIQSGHEQSEVKLVVNLTLEAAAYESENALGSFGSK